MNILSDSPAMVVIQTITSVTSYIIGVRPQAWYCDTTITGSARRNVADRQGLRGGFDALAIKLSCIVPIWRMCSDSSHPHMLC